MKGVRFGVYHSYRDLKLILEKKELGSPDIKEDNTDIPGADGVLDNTEFFGEVKYGNATHKFDFSTMVPHAEFPSHFSQVKNAIHGRRLPITLDDDPTFFFMGRCKVKSFTNEKNIGMLSVECECEPYKYKLAKTTVSRAVDGTEAVVLTNSRKRAVPEVTITTEASLRLEYQGVNIWDLGSGSYTLPELELTEGDNTVTVTGTGTVSFVWQEGEL